MAAISNESEIKRCIEVVLGEESLNEFSFEIEGNSEKGDGYVSDIVFVSLKPTDGSGNKKLVFKCSKRSKVLRETAPVRKGFLNEIYMYERVLPAFVQFQLDKGVTDTFSSAPKCHGSAVTEDGEMIVFDNLKELGYALWDKKKPLTRKHVDLVLGEYAKLHAVSVAMNDQEPGKFEELRCGLNDAFDRFLNDTELLGVFAGAIDEICGLLRGDLDGNVLMKWKILKNKVNFIFSDMISGMDGVKVILHADCWSNNFMFRNSDENDHLPLSVAILDWQISRCGSPILDLSYFLFSSISKEDIVQLEDILRGYYEALSEFVGELGSDLGLLYPVEEFFDDWRKYCKFGLVMGCFMHKIAATAEDQVTDIAEAAENGGHFAKSFEYEAKDKECFKDRSRHVVKYAVENELI